jgi:hypothetical protein
VFLCSSTGYHAADCGAFFAAQCGLFPILYSPQEMAYSVAPSLPHAANAAFLALAYSSEC